MNDERIGPVAALLVRLAAALLGLLAERRRPRQRQHIEIEFAGLVALSLFLGKRGAQRDGNPKTRECNGATDGTGHGTPPSLDENRCRELFPRTENKSRTK